MEKKAEVRLSANFERNLDSIEQFLLEAGVPWTFDILLDGLVEHVIPNLEQYPTLGRLFLRRRQRSAEIKNALAALRKLLGKGDELREYIWSDYLLLYLWNGDSIFLLSIKHHRQLFFDLKSLSKR